MATEVLIPERKGGLSGLFKGFQMFGQGADSFSKIKSAWGTGSTGAETTAGGGESLLGAGAASKYGLNVGNVKPVTTDMSPVLGGGEAAGGSTGEAAASGSTFGEVMGNTIVGPAVGIAGGVYSQQRIGQEMDRRRDTVNNAAKEQIRKNPALSGTRFEDNYSQSGSIDMGPNPNGFNLTGARPDPMGAMERRMQTQQTAMQDIQAAQEQLNVAGLPTEERRRIGQKLELARQTIGGQNRGNRRLYT